MSDKLKRYTLSVSGPSRFFQSDVGDWVTYADAQEMIIRLYEERDARQVILDGLCKRCKADDPICVKIPERCPIFVFTKPWGTTLGIPVEKDDPFGGLDRLAKDSEGRKR